MRSGISYPSYAREADWAAGGGYAVDPDYPVTNLSKLDEPRRVTRAAAAGTYTAAASFAQLRTIDFVALVHHNAPAGATIRVVIYSTLNFTGPYAWDSGAMPVWPEGSSDAGFPNTRPVLLPAPVVGGGVYIEFDNMGGTVCELGGVEVGRFWEWNVEVPRAIGFDTRSATSEAGGLDHVTRQWAPRIVTGERELVAQSEIDTKFMDFQRDTGLNKAFVWNWAVDDASTWARESVLVTNNALPAGAVPDYDVGKMGFSFREHLR